MAKSKIYSCAVCGKDVLRYPSHVKSKYVFCSNKCSYKARSLGLVKRRVTKPYKVTEEGRKGWADAGKRRVGILYKEAVTWVCEICGKERTLPRGKMCPTRKLRFCSVECAKEGNKGSGHFAWKGGYKSYYGEDWQKIRRLSRKRDNNTCLRCGKSSNELGRLPDVHHINPVSSFENVNDSNFMDNTVCLCHSCHMIVEWGGIDFSIDETRDYTVRGCGNA